MASETADLPRGDRPRRSGAPPVPCRRSAAPARTSATRPRSPGRPRASAASAARPCCRRSAAWSRASSGAGRRPAGIGRGSRPRSPTVRLLIELTYGLCGCRSCRIARLEWRWVMAEAVPGSFGIRFAPMAPICRHPDPVQACRECGCWQYDACEDEVRGRGRGPLRLGRHTPPCARPAPGASGRPTPQCSPNSRRSRAVGHTPPRDGPGCAAAARLRAQIRRYTLGWLRTGGRLEVLEGRLLRGGLLYSGRGGRRNQDHHHPLCLLSPARSRERLR